MASITYGNANKYRYMGQEEEEAPEESPGEALRQRILKELVQKQLSTHTSLEQQLNNKKQFVKASCEESVTGCTSGLASFNVFKSVESLLQIKQTLKSCGLTNVEAQLLLDGKSESSPLEAPYARRKRLEEIEKKLARHNQMETSFDKPTQTADTDDLNQDGDKSKTVPGRVEPSCYQDFLPEAHPMNHLKELAEELFPTQEPKESHPEAHTKKRQQEETQVAEPKRNRTEVSKFIYLTEKPESYWDMQQIPKLVKDNTKKLCGPLPLPPEKSNTTIARDKGSAVCVTKKSNNKPVDQTKPFIMTLDPNDLIPLPEIEVNRRSIQELKALDKFKNYTEGEPSPTLYIKNLSPKVSPKDLAALMGHFESHHGPKILYRILGGRMKGQAFVTFQDIEAATHALKVCNGYILHDRPLVAVYGKRT